MAFKEASSQLNFADDGNAAFPRPCELRHVERHTGADDNQVLFAEGALSVLPGLNRDAGIEQYRNFLAKLLRRFGVGDGHACSPLLQKERGSHAGFSQSDDQDAFAVEFHALARSPHCATFASG